MARDSRALLTQAGQIKKNPKWTSMKLISWFCSDLVNAVASKVRERANFQPNRESEKLATISTKKMSRFSKREANENTEANTGFPTVLEAPFGNSVFNVRCIPLGNLVKTKLMYIAEHTENEK